MRPVLLLDVDGVLCCDGSAGLAVGTSGHRGTMPADMVDRVARLTDRFELWWCSAWEAHANAAIAPVLGIEPCPYVRLTVGAGDSWKLPAVAATVEESLPGRAVAWVDDMVGPTAQRWAASRGAPTKVLRVAPERGLRDHHVAELLAFAETHHGVGSHGPRPRVHGIGLRRALFVTGRGVTRALRSIT
jgi:hypothetical protein